MIQNEQWSHVCEIDFDPNLIVVGAVVNDVCVEFHVAVRVALCTSCYVIMRNDFFRRSATPYRTTCTVLSVVLKASDRQSNLPENCKTVSGNLGFLNVARKIKSCFARDLGGDEG